MSRITIVFKIIIQHSYYLINMILIFTISIKSCSLNSLNDYIGYLQKRIRRSIQSIETMAHVRTFYEWNKIKCRFVFHCQIIEIKSNYV